MTSGASTVLVASSITPLRSWLATWPHLASWACQRWDPRRTPWDRVSYTPRASVPLPASRVVTCLAYPYIAGPPEFSGRYFRLHMNCVGDFGTHLPLIYVRYRHVLSFSWCANGPVHGCLRSSRASHGSSPNAALQLAGRPHVHGHAEHACCYAAGEARTRTVWLLPPHR